MQLYLHEELLNSWGKTTKDVPWRAQQCVVAALLQLWQR